MKKTLSIINQDVLTKLLLLSKQISDGQNKFEEVGINISLVDSVGEDLNGIILDYLGVPPDTSLCYLGDGSRIRSYNENDKDCQNCPGCFCRDFLSEILYDFAKGNRSLDEVLENLLHWNSEED